VTATTPVSGRSQTLDILDSNHAACHGESERVLFR
jgi:hypothetical protein